MPIDAPEPVIQPEVVFDKLWLDSTTITTTNRGQPNQSARLVQVWRAYRLLEDGSYEFHPAWKKQVIVEDVYALAAGDPVVAAGLQSFIETSVHMKG